MQQQLSGLLRLVLNLHGPVTRLQELLDAAVVEMRNRSAVIRLSQAVGNWGVSSLESPLAGVAPASRVALRRLYAESGQCLGGLCLTSWQQAARRCDG